MKLNFMLPPGGGVFSLENIRFPQGDARVPPLHLTGTLWAITITDQDIQIGCESHPTQDWQSFSDSRIDSMDKKALGWWRVYKNIILSLASAHQEGR